MSMGYKYTGEKRDVCSGKNEDQDIEVRKATPTTNDVIISA